MRNEPPILGRYYIVRSSTSCMIFGAYEDEYEAELHAETIEGGAFVQEVNPKPSERRRPQPERIPPAPTVTRIDGLKRLTFVGWNPTGYEIEQATEQIEDDGGFIVDFKIIVLTDQRGDDGELVNTAAVWIIFELTPPIDFGDPFATREEPTK